MYIWFCQQQRAAKDWATDAGKVYYKIVSNEPFSLTALYDENRENGR